MHQFEFDSSKAGHLRTLRHTGEKLNKCNKCYYISARLSNFRTHIKTQLGGSFDKYHDFGNITFSWTVHLGIHVEQKYIVGKVKQLQPMWCCILSGKQFEGAFDKFTVIKAYIWGHLKPTVEKRQTNVVSVTLQVENRVEKSPTSAISVINYH